MLGKVNGKDLRMEEVADPSIPRCTVVFEFGIADANSFTYLDAAEVENAIKVINMKPFHVIDVYCAIRYYKWQNEKKTPLKFDYYITRFLFNKKTLEMLVFHERGPRYIAPNDIVNFMASNINNEFSRKVVKPLTTP
ncbi:MAG: hypothetical protein ACP5IM_00400 [Candidatus Bathyarchaeia archaeon]